MFFDIFKISLGSFDSNSCLIHFDVLQCIFNDFYCCSLLPTGARSLRSINEAIRASVAEFIGSLADNLTQVIKDCLSGFTKRFSEEIA